MNLQKKSWTNKSKMIDTSAYQQTAEQFCVLFTMEKDDGSS